jgi:hypothetical protein
MSNVEKYETLTKALAAALFRLGVGTAVFEPRELALPRNTNCAAAAKPMAQLR